MALRHFEALQATTSRAVYSIITGGRLVRVEAGSCKALIKAGLLLFDSLSDGPTGDIVVQKGGTCVRGRGRTPPTLHY